MKVILYWMKNCKFCNKIKEELKNLPKKYEEPIQIEYSNIQTTQIKKYEIRIYPTIIFLSDENKFLEKIQGYKSLDEIIDIYEKIINLENILNS